MGGHHYEVPPKVEMKIEFPTFEKITPEEVEDFFKWKKLQQDKDLVDLRPMFLDEVVKGAKKERWALRQEREEARAEREELELLRSQIAQERKGLAEESAFLMKQKRGLLDAESMFHGGVMTGTEVIGQGLDFSKLPTRTKMPEVVTETSKVWDEVVVPVGLGFGIGAGMTALALFIKGQLDKQDKKKAEKKKVEMDNSSDGLIIEDDD